MSSATPPEFDLRPSFGALYIGIMTSIGLLGVSTLQTWLYYSRYPRDPASLRIMVAVVWILDLVHSIFGAHALYHYVIVNWGNPLALERSIWSLDSTLLITGIVETIVRAFFMRRVYIVSGRKWTYCSLIGLFGLFSISFNIATWVLSITAVDFANFGHTIYVVSTTGLSSSIAADATISATLASFLNSKRTGFSRTNRVINRLIFFAINIGIATSLTDVAVLACSTALSGPSLAYLSVYQVVSKLYANSLLATLNVREADKVASRQDDSAYRLSEMHSRPVENTGNTLDTGFTIQSGTLVDKTCSDTGLSSVEPSEDKVYNYAVNVPQGLPEGSV